MRSKGQVADIDQQIGLAHPEPQMVDEVRPSGEEHTARLLGQERDSAGSVTARVRSETDSWLCLLPYVLYLLFFLCLLDGLPDRRDDVGIGGAAAEIAAHALADLLVVEGDVRSRQISAHRAGPAGLGLAQHADRRAELARGTVAALEGVMVDERLLERMQVVAIGCQPLDGDDLGVLVRDGEGQAAIHAPAVEQDGAGSALPVVAALLGAGEAEPLAQRIQQRRPRIDNKRMCCPVHPQGDLKVHRKRVSFGRVSYKQLSAFKRKKNIH